MAAPLKCHYVILGVPYSSKTVDIKSKYRTLVRRFHPDVDQTSAGNEFFIQIQEAYDVLGNENTRCVYDRERIARNKSIFRNSTAASENSNSPFTGDIPKATPMREDWWLNSDTIRDFTQKKFEAEAAEKRRRFEAKSTTFRWPTGETYEKMDEHQRYFFHRNMRGPRRSFSTSTTTRPTGGGLVSLVRRGLKLL
jgi:curved DNA-binding protein CbpA